MRSMIYNSIAVRKLRTSYLFQERFVIIYLLKRLPRKCSDLQKTVYNIIEMSFYWIDSSSWRSEDRLVNDDVDDMFAGMHGNDDVRLVAGCQEPEAGVDCGWAGLRCYSPCSLQTSDGPLCSTTVSYQMLTRKLTAVMDLWIWNE